MEFDPSHIVTAIEYTTKGTRALQSVVDLYKSFQKKKDEDGGKVDDAEVQQFIIELMEQVTEAKLANVDMKEQLIELKEQLLDFQKSTEQFGNYEMYTAGTGTVIWKLKDNIETSEQPHFICPNCKESGRRSILQGGQSIKTCYSCDKNFRLQPMKQIRRGSSAGGSWMD